MSNSKFSKKVGQVAPAPPTPVYTVGDEEDFQPEQEVAFEAPEPTPATDELVDRELKKQLLMEKLLFLKKPILKTYSIGEFEVTFKLPRTQDNANILRVVQSLPEEEQAKKIALAVLADAVVDIGGIPLLDLYEGEGAVKEPLLRKYEVLNAWPTALTDSMKIALDTFLKESAAQYSVNLLKK
jgi:hypothetical protein